MWISSGIASLPRPWTLLVWVAGDGQRASASLFIVRPRGSRAWPWPSTRRHGLSWYWTPGPWALPRAQSLDTYPGSPEPGSLSGAMPFVLEGVKSCGGWNFHIVDDGAKPAFRAMKKTKETRASFCLFLRGCNARRVVLGLNGRGTEESLRAANSAWTPFCTGRKKSTEEFIGHVLNVSVFALGLGDSRGSDT